MGGQNYFVFEVNGFDKSIMIIWHLKSTIFIHNIDKD